VENTMSIPHPNKEEDIRKAFYVFLVVAQGNVRQ
jgi:hypothetical protein